MADNAYSGTVQANGSLSIEIRSRPQTWQVSQVSVFGAAAPAGSTCILRKNGSFITPIIATGGAATGPPDVHLGPGDVLTVDFTGHTAGTVFEVYIIYEVIR